MSRLLTNEVDSKEFIHSFIWERKSLEVRERYNNECQECLKLGKYTRAVLVHHDKPSKDYPELRLSDTWTDADGVEHPQLIPLCHACHEMIETERGNRPGQPVERVVTDERWD